MSPVTCLALVAAPDVPLKPEPHYVIELVEVPHAERREAVVARASLHDPFLHEVQVADRAIHAAADEEDAAYAALDAMGEEEE